MHPVGVAATHTLETPPSMYEASAPSRATVENVVDAGVMAVVVELQLPFTHAHNFVPS